MLAEIERRMRAGGDGLGEVKRFARDVEEIARRLGRPELARETLRSLREHLEEALPAPAPIGQPPAPATFLTCEACKFTWSEPQMTSCITVPGAQNARPDGPFPCPMCAKKSAEAQLLPQSKDGWWIEVATKARKAMEADPGWGPEGLEPLGFFEAECHAGSMMSVIARPQLVFRPLYVVVAPECDDGILVDFKVGNRSQEMNWTPTPLSALNPRNWASMEALLRVTCRRCDTATAAMDVTLCVEMHKRSHFRAVVWGYGARHSDVYGHAPAVDAAMRAVSATPAFHSLVERIKGEGSPAVPRVSSFGGHGGAGGGSSPSFSGGSGGCGGSGGPRLG